MDSNIRVKQTTDTVEELGALVRWATVSLLALSVPFIIVASIGYAISLFV